MCRVLGVLVLMAMLIPRLSSALQLHWGSGATTLSFTEATRCTLVVQADSSESRLPAEWRLLWVADSSTDIHPVAIDAQLACEEVVAQVSAVDEPATSADSAAHLRTIHFCSEDGPASTVAQYLLDLPAESRGRFKAVALDPSDSTQVIESNEVTFNGGAWDEYSPVMLAASSTHQASLFTVRAIGAGLAGVRSASIAGLDGQWKVSLGIVEHSDSILIASTEIATDVPASILQATDEVRSASTTLAANSSYSQRNPEWVPSLMREAFTQEEKDAMTLDPPDGRIQPKDFAFLFAQNKFHLFYIRLNMWNPTYRTTRFADSTEKDLGHVRSWVLEDDWKWTVPPTVEPVDSAAFSVRPGEWDSFHVWAPHIVARNGTFHMFYTGVGDTVDSEGHHLHHQRIGIATSTDLENWQRYDRLLTVFDVPWASRNCTAVEGGSHQLRDPFVMQDPVHPGGWLMYFVAVDSAKAPAMAVGVARSDGDFRTWIADAHPIRSTDVDAADHAFRIESPHVIQHEGRHWLFFTSGSPYGGEDRLPYNPVMFVVTDSLGDPTDTLATSWTAPESLYKYQTVQGARLDHWHGSEYLTIGDHEYLAAYDDHNMGIAIGELNWYGPHDFIVGSASVADLAVPGGTTGGAAPALLNVSSTLPARGRLDLRIEVPTPMHARVAIYDVAGRRVKSLVDRDLGAGATTTRWDGRDATGLAVRSGIYFVRLDCAAGRRMVKAVWLR